VVGPRARDRGTRVRVGDRRAQNAPQNSGAVGVRGVERHVDGLQTVDGSRVRRTPIPRPRRVRRWGPPAQAPSAAPAAH